MLQAGHGVPIKKKNLNDLGQQIFPVPEKRAKSRADHCAAQLTGLAWTLLSTVSRSFPTFASEALMLLPTLSSNAPSAES